MAKESEKKHENLSAKEVYEKISKIKETQSYANLMKYLPPEGRRNIQESVERRPKLVSLADIEKLLNSHFSFSGACVDYIKFRKENYEGNLLDLNVYDDGYCLSMQYASPFPTLSADYKDKEVRQFFKDKGIKLKYALETREGGFGSEFVTEAMPLDKVIELYKKIEANMKTLKWSKDEHDAWQAEKSKELQKNKSSFLESKLSLIVLAAGLIAGLFLLSSSITGNAVANLPIKTASFFCTGLILLGLAAGFFWFRHLIKYKKS